MSKLVLPRSEAKKIWIHAQKLDEKNPFGSGPDAVKLAAEHLGYIQIDTIHVIERSHHHILFNRIPDYHREDLGRAQSTDKTVFEYWTHALSYVPIRDFKFFVGDMKAFRKKPSSWYVDVEMKEVRKMLRTIRDQGPLSIRDVGEEALVEKDHPWASKKPSKKVLQFGFYAGLFTISERIGMLKKYELLDRHYEWNALPKAATEKEYLAYSLERALRSQGIVNLDSICYLDAPRKAAIKKHIHSFVRKGELVEMELEGTKGPHWVKPELLDEGSLRESELTHILSPFDPLTIQRKRFNAFFDYDHRFEAYLPQEKRKYGYFGLPVLHGDQIVAVLDLKTDRQKNKLLIQKWTWLKKFKSAETKRSIESELDRFESFQLAKTRTV